MLLTAAQLLAQLRAGDETVQIEAKRASDVGRALHFTVTSYSNEPGLGGGYFLLGVVKGSGPMAYEVVGVPDPDKLQSDLASQCATMFNRPLRPQISVEQLEGKPVVVVHIPEVHPNEKPVYVRKHGLPQGACRRIGATDQHCTDDDVRMFWEKQNETSYDSTIIPDATFNDLDLSAIDEYRRTRLNQEAEELALSDGDLLQAVGAVVGTNITRAGLLLFGKDAALRRFCPSARVDYILVSGPDWVPDTTEPVRSTEVRQPLLFAIPRLAGLVLQDLPKVFQLKGRALRRKEVPAIPARVIREALVNAVMHRSYRAQQPVQIIRFSNRLEIRNPGHSLVSDEELGEPGSKTRNERLAAVLHDCGYAETKGTGIRVMRDQMRSVNMTEPIFRSSRQQDSFEVTLLTHHLFDDATLRWLSSIGASKLTDHDAKALVIARETGFLDNSMYRNLNGVDVLAASLALRRLRDDGLLISEGKSTATFYRLAPEILGKNSPQDKPALKRGSNPQDKASVPLRMTPELVALLRQLGERTRDRRLIDVAILKLCAVAPLTLTEIARYVQREPVYVQQRFLSRMIKSGELQFLYPDRPAHPKQAYTTAPWMAEIEIPGEPKPRNRKKKSEDPKLF
jgi:ATP-dependent DNA helicase RecG